MYLAIDPGAHPGFACLDSQMRLFTCGIGDPYSPSMGVVRAVIYEKPTVYPHSKVDPNNIVTLAVTAGNLIDPYRRAGVKVLSVEPRTWKGSVPKQIHHARILHALTPLEQDVVAQCGKGIAPKWREDMMDAVGLSQYARKMRLFV